MPLAHALIVALTSPNCQAQHLQSGHVRLLLYSARDQACRRFARPRVMTLPEEVQATATACFTHLPGNLD